jgi:protein-tyrosine phosphatase
VLEPVLGVQADYLHAALDEMKQRFGSIEAYFGEGLGIDAAGQQRLRDALVGS